MHGFGPDIRLGHNGGASDPPRASPASGTQFDAFQSYAGKTIGYAGNLETKIDIELLSRVADRFRDCQVVLIGSTHANPAVLELLRHPNVRLPGVVPYRSEEHTSELQSLMRISYAVFCLKKKNIN